MSVLPGGLPPAAVALPVPPPEPAPTPAPAPAPDDPSTPPAEELLGITTEVACQAHLLKLGPLRIDELPALPDLGLGGLDR